jgi:N-acetylneuraminic acid mutarotase
MKHLLFIVLFALSTFAETKIDNLNIKPTQTLSWSTLPNTLVGCMAVAGACMNGNYYQIGGVWGSYSTYKYAQIFDGATWTQSTCFHPDGIDSHSAAVWNNKIVISGGGSYNPPSHIYSYTTIYDPVAQTWTVSTPMARSMIDTTMASLNNKCYLFGGYDGDSFNSTYCWTPGDASMSVKANMPAPCANVACAVYNGKIYLFGGYSFPTQVYKSIWEYNPNNDSWVVKSATLSDNTAGAVAVPIGDLIYILGGFNLSQSEMNKVEIYNPVSDSITSGTPMPYSTSRHAAAGYTIPLSNTTYTGKIYVSGGGWSDDPYSTAIMGTVSGVYCSKVQQSSLGAIKASFH